MMRRKIIYLCAIGVLTTAVFTGCGDGSEETGLIQQAVAVESEPLLSETERAICDYELKYSTGTFQMQDYHTLADLYQEVGMIRKQRDMLEESYRLFEDAEALAKLATIAVNLAEEEEAIVQEAETMLQNLDLPEYLNESVNLISSSRFVRTLMPKLSEGKRSYFLQKDGRTALVIEVGYGENGLPYSNVWYIDDASQLKLLQYGDNTVQMLQTTMADGVYDGAFELWYVDGNNGNIRHEQGTFAEGIYIGDYTAEVHMGTEGSDLFALWSHRDTMVYTTYTGHFDEQGRTTLEQPAAENQAALIAGSDKAGCVVYAYDESGLNCLFWGLEEGVEPGTYSFDVTNMGLTVYPAITVYEVETAEETSEEETFEAPQIRIYDGEIQYYNGYRWISMGKADAYAKEDPFYAYAENKEEIENKLWGALMGSAGSNVGEDAEGSNSTENSDGTASLGMGAIATPTPTPAPTKKPSTTKPAVTQQPTVVQTPAPTTVPSTPVPDDDDDDDGGSGDSSSGSDSSSGGSSGSDSSSGGGSGSDSSGGSDSSSGGSSGSDDGGGDTDIEWSPDLM